MVADLDIPHLHALCSINAANPANGLGVNNFKGNIQNLMEEGYVTIKTLGNDDFVYPTKAAFEKMREFGIPMRKRANDPDPYSSWLGLRLETELYYEMKELLPDFRILHGPVIEFTDYVTGDKRTQYDLVFIRRNTNHCILLECKFRNGTPTAKPIPLFAPARDTSGLWMQGKRIDTRYSSQILKQRRVLEACGEKSIPKLNHHLKYKFTEKPTVDSLLYWYGPVSIARKQTQDIIIVNNQWRIIPAQVSPDGHIDENDTYRLATIIRALANEHAKQQNNSDD